MIDTPKTSYRVALPRRRKTKLPDIITAEALNDLGFLSLENGQYELHTPDSVYLSFFTDEHTVGLKKMSKSMPLSSCFGYHQSIVGRDITSLSELRSLMGLS